MTLRHSLSFAVVSMALLVRAQGQVPDLASAPAPSPAMAVRPVSSMLPGSLQTATSANQPLFADFHEADLKFPVQSLMKVLRDPRHEGWVLAAYPDPKTKKPLIGAGFSLDLEARDHPQLDPLNPHTFVEPSSAQLWQAAGLDPDRLQSILDRYNRDLKAWSARRYRRKAVTRSLTAQITDEEATSLLRISAIQAIWNARAYCRTFDELTGPQQMAMSQLVFQMGVNLEEFTQFLSVLNGDANPIATPAAAVVETEDDRWKSVQRALMDSQWATHYSTRAISVIAMFDPAYSKSPSQAERMVAVALHPAVVHARGSRAKPQLRTASLNKLNKGRNRTARGKTPASKRKRKLA